MKNFLTFNKYSLVPVTVGVAVGVLMLVTLVQAATTLSTNVSTDGNVYTTGGVDTVSAGTLSIGTTLATALTVGATSITTTFPGHIAVTGSATTTGNSVTTGTASSTKLMVGSDQVSTISGIIAGYCTIAATVLTASTTSYVSCASATGLTSSYRVFVQATSTPPAVVIVAASSTTGAINVGVLDTGLGTTTIGYIGPTSLNFWAVR